MVADDIDPLDLFVPVPPTVVCPVCERQGRGQVIVAYLGEDRRRWVLRGVAPAPWAEPGDIPQSPGADITASMRKRVHLSCPEPRCGRILGPYTLAGLLKRHSAGQPLIVD